MNWIFRLWIGAVLVLAATPGVACDNANPATGIAEDSGVISLTLPETCHELRFRKVKRHPCRGVQAEFIQAGVVLSGFLVEFSAVSFCIEVTVVPPQSFLWVNLKTAVTIILRKEGQVVFSGGIPGTDSLGLLVTPADGTGSVRALTRDNGGNAQWSPRGDRVLYQADDGAGHKQVFVINADGSGKKQLTSGKSNDGQPAWSRDGSAIFWRSDQNGTAWAIFAMNADGSGPRRILSDVPPDPHLWGWESLSVGP